MGINSAVMFTNNMPLKVPKEAGLVHIYAIRWIEGVSMIRIKGLPSSVGGDVFEGCGVWGARKSTIEGM